MAIKVFKPILWSGYYFVKNHKHYRANKQGYVKVCDLIVEKELNIKLKKNEVVHHKNSIKTDDKIENLEVMTKKEHDRLTTKKRWDKWEKDNRWSYKFKKCVKCGTTKYKHSARGYCKYCYKKYIERKK